MKTFPAVKIKNGTVEKKTDGPTVLIAARVNYLNRSGTETVFFFFFINLKKKIALPVFVRVHAIPDDCEETEVAMDGRSRGNEKRPSVHS